MVCHELAQSLLECRATPARTHIYAALSVVEQHLRQGRRDFAVLDKRANNSDRWGSCPTTSIRDADNLQPPRNNREGWWC
jgi:hypothetical protein